VAVYLDTNVMHDWTTFTELNRLVISIVAGQLGQPLVLPQIVVDEAEGHMSRLLEDAVRQFEAAEETVSELFATEYVHIEPFPDTAARLARWRSQLEEVFEVVPMDPADAVEGLRREIVGEPPAKPRQPGKPGAGARDVALWLALVRDHAERGEEGHFITKNHKDFLAGTELKAALTRELDGAPSLNVYRSVEEFIAQLGTPDTSEQMGVDELSERAGEAVRAALADSRAVADAVFDERGDLRVRNRVLSATPTRVFRTRRYVAGNTTVTLASADWDLLVECVYQRVGDDPGSWYGGYEVHVRGPIHVYLPGVSDRDRQPQFIAAHLTAAGQVYVMSDDRGVLLSGELTGGNRNRDSDSANDATEAD
jgi:hypothetical protein